MTINDDSVGNYGRCISSIAISVNDRYVYEKDEKVKRTTARVPLNHIHLRTELVSNLLDRCHLIVDMLCEYLGFRDIVTDTTDDLFGCGYALINMACKLLSRPDIAVDILEDLLDYRNLIIDVLCNLQRSRRRQ